MTTKKDKIEWIKAKDIEPGTAFLGTCFNKGVSSYGSAYLILRTRTDNTLVAFNYIHSAGDGFLRAQVGDTVLVRYLGKQIWSIGVSPQIQEINTVTPEIERIKQKIKQAQHRVEMTRQTLQRWKKKLETLEGVQTETPKAKDPTVKLKGRPTKISKLKKKRGRPVGKPFPKQAVADELRYIVGL